MTIELPRGRHRLKWWSIKREAHEIWNRALKRRIQFTIMGGDEIQTENDRFAGSVLAISNFSWVWRWETRKPYRYRVWYWQEGQPWQLHEGSTRSRYEGNKLVEVVGDFPAAVLTATQDDPYFLDAPEFFHAS